MEIVDLKTLIHQLKPQCKRLLSNYGFFILTVLVLFQKQPLMIGLTTSFYRFLKVLS